MTQDEPREHMEIGQKCSACSRAYVPDTLWPEVKEKLTKEHEKIQVGRVEGTSILHGKQPEAG